MPLSPAQMDQKLDEHFGYEASDNVEGVLATLSQDATHDIVGWPTGPSRDHASIRGFYETLFTDLADGKATSLSRRYGENFMVDESLWEGRAPGRPFGIQGNNRPLAFRLLHVLEFKDDGQIQKEQVWVDLASILQQLAPPSAA